MNHFNIKYDLKTRQKAIRLFKTMTAREVAKKMNMSHGEIIGLLETSRRFGLLPPNFKDKRNKTPWSFEERLKLIQMAGLISREEIGKRLNRNGQRNIKERMKNDFNSGTKFLHGMPLTWVKEIIPIDLSDRLIQTKAGPCSIQNRTMFKIVPWVDLEQVQYAVRLPKNLASAIRALAKFQRFIWKTDEDYKIRDYIKGVINGKPRLSNKRTIQHKNNRKKA